MAKHQNYWFETEAPTIVNRSGIISNADVLIIGGGISGLLVLWQLLRSGVKNVYLVEESHVGYRASGRSSGQLMMRGSRSFSDIFHSYGLKAVNDYIDFIAANNEIMRAWIDEHDLFCDLQEGGGLRLAVDDDELIDLQEEAEIINSAMCGVNPTMLNRDEVKGILFSERFVGAMYVPTDATFNPYMLVNKITAKLDASGRRILSGCSVEEITQRDEGWAVKIRNKGTITAKHVVHCTNAYASQLLPEFKDFTVNVRAQMIASDKLPESAQKAMPKMSLSCNYGSEYFRLYKDRLLMGGMRHKVRGAQRDIIADGEVSRAVGQHLKNFMEESFPYIKTPPTHTWSGIISQTNDGFPLVGPIPGRENQYINAGFNGYGFSHALLASYAIRDLITVGETELPAISMFDPARAL